MSARKKIHSVEDAIKRIERLEAENKELRNLWIENEGDIISVKSVFQRYIRMNWHQRLFIKHDNELLYKDRQTPKLSRRQCYIYKPMYDFFNEGVHDIEPPHKNKWFGIKLRLFKYFSTKVYIEGNRLSKKHNANVFHSRKGIKGLF